MPKITFTFRIVSFTIVSPNARRSLNKLSNQRSSYFILGNLLTKLNYPLTKFCCSPLQIIYLLWSFVHLKIV